MLYHRIPHWCTACVMLLSLLTLLPAQSVKKDSQVGVSRACQSPRLLSGLQVQSFVPIGTADALRKNITNSVGMKLTLIPAGKFKMGSPAKEKARHGDEAPQHDVQITNPFYMGIHEVTQEEYQTVIGANPSFFSAKGFGKGKVKRLETKRFPVERVSWKDAVQFCKKLSNLPKERASGHVYRLPTEAEWEYACRGGAASYQVFHFGNSLSSTQANFDGGSPYGSAAKGPYLVRTTTVGSYKPNAFGVYDMHGNVWEWCSDWYLYKYYSKSPPKDPQGPQTGKLRVTRGGSWSFHGGGCRAANRLSLVPSYRNYDMGFRVVLVVPCPTR